MLCIASFIVLSILGLFSATHRKLAREALDCVLRRVTMRPCNTGFDTKIKSKILGSLINRSPVLAKFVAKRFEWLAWTFMILILISTAWSMRGLYNFWAWGDCNGQFTDGSFCVFDPSGENSKTGSDEEEKCVDAKLASKTLSVQRGDRSAFPILWRGERNNPEVLFVGCYACDFTRKAYPLLKKVFTEKSVAVRFGHSVTKHSTEYLLPYDVCVQQLEPEKFDDYVDRLFMSGKEQIADKEYADKIIADSGIEREAFDRCLSDPKTTSMVENQQQQLRNIGIYGTPSVFINNTAIVGPKPERVYQRFL